MDVQSYIQERLPLVDRALDRQLPPDTEPPSELHAAMRHLVFPGGKRLRPMFAFAAAEATGAPSERALPAACAVELVHTYSLIHDDLPCMDDDDERRGRPTVHVKYGEAVAVLAGDALLALAFETIATPHAEFVDAPESTGSVQAPGYALRAVAAVRELAHAAGPSGLVGGQVADLAFPSGGEGSAPEIESVHERKSAALIAASIVTGARLAGADDELLGRLHRFGRDVGVAFQIADDLLDLDGDDVCSLARKLGTGAARERSKELLERSLALLENWGEPAEPLRELARYAVWRDR
jgi:geranylgeranyl diphosphate synthase type II